jgi:hypothetical protein
MEVGREEAGKPMLHDSLIVISESKGLVVAGQAPPLGQ